MAQFQTFTLSPENDVAITKFLKENNVVDNGLIVGDGTISFMYRDKNDLGATKDTLLTELSKKLSDASKNVMLEQMDMDEQKYAIENFKGSEDKKQGFQDQYDASVEAHKFTHWKIEQIIKKIKEVQSGEFVIPTIA